MDALSEQTQKAQHFEHMYNEASVGKCGFSGLAFASCKASICDCFEFGWVRPGTSVLLEDDGNTSKVTDSSTEEYVLVSFNGLDRDARLALLVDLLENPHVIVENIAREEGWEDSVTVRPT